MPWHQETMKEVQACQKLREAGNEAVIRGFPNGETRFGKAKALMPEHIGYKRQRRELKHLSNVWKRK